ncbi:MAG: site-specific DNA-methyltransferase, partial [Helicobacteraceae bacterium]|nr:site-specific DNA-methyltransferase [Helicobacteraceae bacterium]
MSEVPDSSVDLIITSPPYFNIKDYAKDGYQAQSHSTKQSQDLGALDDYESYINELLVVWR